MRAAVLEGPRQVAVREVPPAPLAARKVRVQVEEAGLCGSDLALWEGRPWFRYPQAPGAPGHEAWGRVVAVGEGADGFRPDDLVTGLFHGALAEQVDAAPEELMAVPPALAKQGLLGEPLACAANAVARSGVQAGETVAVVGIGFQGALITALCAAAGARVLALSRRPFALRTALRHGAAAALAADANAVKAVEEHTRRQLCDRVFEVTGKQEPLDLATKLTKTRGTLVIAGYHQDGPRTVDLWLWNWRGLDVVNAHERDPRAYLAGMRRAAEAVVSGKVDPAPLYTHHFPLDEVAEAFRALEHRPDGFLKAVVRP